MKTDEEWDEIFLNSDTLIGACMRLKLAWLELLESVKDALNTKHD